ncbi:La- protein 4B [Podila clonocystis]|nr:La- protein 4B [Podila clonocystis]
MLGPPGQHWGSHVPQDLESAPDNYSRLSWQKRHPVNHISGNFDPGRSFNTIERSQSGARHGPNHQYHGKSTRSEGSIQQERPPHGQKQPNGQNRGRPTKFSNRIPFPHPPYDVNRNHYLPEEYGILTHSNKAKRYVTSVPNTRSDIHFSDRSYNKDISNVYPTSSLQMREPPNLNNDSWRPNMMAPPEMPRYPYSMPWGPYHGPSPSMPMPPTMPTPHYEAIQDDQDDIEIILGPEHESSSAFASAGASEYADKGRDRLREQLEHYFSPSNLAVDTFLVSHMNAERFVPISVIADFKRVKAVTRNVDEIVAALRRSSVVIVDETGTNVKPVPAKPRTTLIIRDLPYETQSKEISDLFEVAKCPAKEIVKEVGNTWFVEFETPEEALAMLSYIRGKTLRGVPLAGRLKSNTAFTGGTNNAVTPNRPVEQKSSSPTEYGPTLDGGWISSSSSDTADYSPPFGRPAYRRFPLEPEEYSPYSLQGSWPSTATEFPFYDTSSPMINPAKAGQETAQQGLPPMPDIPYHQERQLHMATTPSINTAAAMSQEPQGSKTHGQSTLPPWIETPTQFAPSNSKNKNKKKNRNQKKKKVANQENKDTSDPIDTVTNKLSDMTACGDKLAKCSQHDHRHKNDSSSTAHEDKTALSRQLDHHHKKDNDKIINITSNPDNKPYKYKSNRSNNHVNTSGPSVGYNNKGKGIKQHKKDKEPDVSRDSSILKIDNFPPLSSSHLPTASYAQVVHKDSLAKGPQTSKKTKWQPLAYESITKLQEETLHSSKGCLPHGDGVAE